ncbi:hypothetical protein AYJ57_20530 (plasmid) [Salipiger sp. CCB-MM3]|uniref:hypothetical protein n=1 Tax=Salipiger sp. CCB-MM3 TaxID=1792508 RepID=UPI00080A99AD|nr:hypothetical protein [Salipiger sp. CCB-MM3]ANT62875.1 hypothetical protein AYJ57_20530 [Salipiger sp. CCB-MM3]
MLKFVLAAVTISFGVWFGLRQISPDPTEIPPILATDSDAQKVVATVDGCTLKVVATYTRACGYRKDAVIHAKRYEIDLTTARDIYASVVGGRTFILFMDGPKFPWQTNGAQGVTNTIYQENCDGVVSELPYNRLPTVRISKPLTGKQIRTLAAYTKACR